MERRVFGQDRVSCPEVPGETFAKHFETAYASPRHTACPIVRKETNDDCDFRDVEGMRRKTRLLKRNDGERKGIRIARFFSIAGLLLVRAFELSRPLNPCPDFPESIASRTDAIWCRMREEGNQCQDLVAFPTKRVRLVAVLSPRALRGLI